MKLLILNLMELNLKVDWLKTPKKRGILLHAGVKMRLIKIDLLTVKNQKIN